MLFSKQISGFVAGALVAMSFGLGVAAATPAFAATNTKSSTTQVVNRNNTTQVVSRNNTTQVVRKKNGWYDTGVSREVAVKTELQTGKYTVKKKTYKYRVRDIYKNQKQQAYYKNGKKTSTRWVADKNGYEPWEYSNVKPTGYSTKWISLLRNSAESSVLTNGTSKK